MENLPKFTPTQALLLRRGWMETGDGNVLTDAGYPVAGRKRPAPPEDVQPLDAFDALQRVGGISARRYQASRAGGGAAPTAGRDQSFHAA